MKAFRLTGSGFDALEACDCQRPRPGSGQVLVQMRANSLNARDLMQLRGEGGRQAVIGRIPLSDGAGDVVEVGASVARLHVGDRVLGAFYPRWQSGPPDPLKLRDLPGTTEDGMLAEFRVFDEDALVILPGRLSYEEGAALPCAAVTAWGALTGGKRIHPGDTVLLQGSSSVSLFALQFARAMGAIVYVTTSSDEKAEKLRSLGAEETINYSARPDWDVALRKLTADRGVDFVLDMTGAASIERSVKTLASGGELVVVGRLAMTAELIDPALLTLTNIVIRRQIVGSSEDLNRVIRAVDRLAIRPQIESVFEFSASREAYRDFDRGSHFGKIVIAHN